MTQTSNRIFDEMARLMNDAAGVAQGVRREFDSLFRSQADRILRELDVVPREEFEAVKEMARLAREENEALRCASKRSKPRARRRRPRPRRQSFRRSRRAPRRSGSSVPCPPRTRERCRERGETPIPCAFSLPPL